MHFKFEKFINLLDLFPILFLTSLFYAFLKKEAYSFLFELELSNTPFAELLK